MAKGRGGRKREIKKPKGGNKSIETGTAFLPVPPVGPKPTAKGSTK